MKTFLRLSFSILLSFIVCDSAAKSRYPYDFREQNGLYFFETSNVAFETVKEKDCDEYFNPYMFIGVGDAVTEGGIGVVGAEGKSPMISVQIVSSSYGVSKLVEKVGTPGECIPGNVKLVLSNGEVFHMDQSFIFNMTGENARQVGFGIVNLVMSIDSFNSSKIVSGVMSQYEKIAYMIERLSKYNLVELELDGFIDINIDHSKTAKTFAAMFKDLSKKTGFFFDIKMKDIKEWHPVEMTVSQMINMPFGSVLWSLFAEKVKSQLQSAYNWPFSYRDDGRVAVVETSEDLENSIPYFLTYENIGGHCQYETYWHGAGSKCIYCFYFEFKKDALEFAQKISSELELMGIKMYDVSENKQIYCYFSGEEDNINTGKLYNQRTYGVTVKKKNGQYIAELVIIYIKKWS